MPEAPSISPGHPVLDVVVAGAGIAGAGLALAVKLAGGHAVHVALCDPALARWPAKPSTMRAFAIAPDAFAFLDRMRAWRGLATDLQPIRTMVITDARPGLLPNPEFIHFEDGGRPLAHMVLADPLRAALLDGCAEAGVVFHPAGVRGFRDEAHTLSLDLSDGRPMRARLLVAGDGARSRLRHAARIQTVGRDYPQAAIVATLRHDADHDGRATQHFFPGGPLALLPLRASDGSGRRSSLVWTEARPAVKRLMGLSGPDFTAALQQRASYERGVLSLEDQPVAFPLRIEVARRLTAHRFALLGDAARTIHPLAGQGLNLGLRDAAALTGAVSEALRVGLDPGSADVLARYERERRGDGAAMAVLTDALDRLFSNDRAPLRALRDFGLSLIDHAPGLKRRLVRSAGGGSLAFSDPSPASDRARHPGW